MKKPVVNLDELEFRRFGKGSFEHSWAPIAEKIGARLLGYNLNRVPPGHKGVPYHVHRNNEEMVVILEGSGTLRFGENTYPLRKHDVCAFPPGDRAVAHQIINTGDTELVYLAMSTRNAVDIWEYPDAGKVGFEGGDDLRKFYRAEDDVDYWEREDG